MKNRETILKMLEDNSITVSEALALLNKDDEDAKQNIAKISEDTVINKIAINIINYYDFDINSVVKIMQDKNWHYRFNDHVVTEEEVYDCIKSNIRSAIEELIKKIRDKASDEYISVESGGFRVVAYIDDENGIKALAVKVDFVPHTAYTELDYDMFKRLL